MKVGIIGAGAMGRAMARRAALAGADVLLTDPSTVRAGRVAREVTAGAPGTVTAAAARSALRPGLVILALDRAETLGFLRSQRRSLTGKVLVEVTAPHHEPCGTGMGELTAAAPGASWVRACAAGDAESIYRGLIDGHPVDVFVAADDESAKIRVIELADRSGLRALDAGHLDRARVLDELTSLGREISHRLAAPEGWGIKLLPSW
ncbi:NAD(P)-binding domain-containing protein [Streptomyces sp. NPDC127092]|uniref:NAD(P)-binding domain-containing protein n=1 Tax=Streptomyces sp. NPDC127092 TaxID=3347135 RepID=UPI003662ACFC